MDTPKTFEHPASKWKLQVFARCDGGMEGPQFAVKFDKLALIWTGTNKAKLIADAEGFRFDTIVKFESVTKKRNKKRKIVHKDDFEKDVDKLMGDGEDEE